MNKISGTSRIKSACFRKERRNENLIPSYEQNHDFFHNESPLLKHFRFMQSALHGFSNVKRLLAVDRAAGDKNHVVTFFYFTLPNTVVFLHKPSGSVSLYTVSYFFAC